MLQEREAIRAHAVERLRAEGETLEHERQVEQFRRFLKLETDRLRMRQRMGAGGLDVAAMRSYQVDQVVTRACQVGAEAAGPGAASELARCAVVALGGYGRAELAPCSDVDLLFLHRGGRHEALPAFVERVLMLLWDSGLSVGHSFRSARECATVSRDDLVSRTSLTESRLVAGNPERLRELHAAMEDLLGNRRARDSFLIAMRREQAERHARFQSAVCLQEPNVKEGVGGLRELHTVLWVAHARLGARGLAGLEAGGWISEREHRLVRRAYDFLLRVRNEAHFVTARRTDLLSLDLQDELARRLGYLQKGGMLGSELFMRDYYRRASELAEFARGFVSRLDAPPPAASVLGRLRGRRGVRGLELRGGRLHTRGDGLAGGGAALLDAFATAQAEAVTLSDELREAVRERLSYVDGAFRRDVAASRAFLDLLRWRGRVGPALRAMHQTGFLGRYLPEFGRVSFLVQHDFFHRYTVDEHTLRAIEALDEVAAGVEPAVRPFGRVLDEVVDALPLYLGLLLHDVGKGRGGGHCERGARLAERVCERLGVPAREAGDVVFLVEAHLEMSQISQQRDLGEPALVESFAARVGSLERLNLLLLLTYADHRGVGPGIWNEWKGALLWELYHRTRERLAGRTEASDAGHRAQARAVARLLREAPETEVERHFALMPERYLRSTDADSMERHFRLLERKGDAPVAFGWRDLPDGHCTELTVAAADHEGLFAKLAGSLTSAGVDILSVDLFGRGDGQALDTFRLSEIAGHRPLGPERRARVEERVREALAGRLDVHAAVDKWRSQRPPAPRRKWGRAARPASVRFDHEASATSTVIEVKAQDRPGLAWTIADALARLGLNITFAKIATAKALALDVFYVTDCGRKLDPESLPRVESTLLAALEERAPVHFKEER